MRVARLLVASGSIGWMWLLSGCANSGATAYLDPTVMNDGGAPSLNQTSYGPTTPCQNLQCQKVTCPNGKETTVSGMVFTPSATRPDPLYNAIVYVPNSPLEPFSKGATCDRCGTIESGSPMATTLSGSDGSFTLSGMPVGKNIPLVVQVGRWRRQVTIPEVKACEDTPLDAELTRLPRNHTEGDIPQIAISTGEADPFECILRKIGIDDSEFTSATGTGRVHIYKENGADMATPVLPATDLYADAATLENYDMVILACEGMENKKSAQALAAMTAYANNGGRIFTTHYGYVWLEFASQFANSALWMPEQPMGDPTIGSIDTTFPKGDAFAAWLSINGASDAFSQLSINEARRNNSGVGHGVQRWIYTDGDLASAQHFTFNTPVDVGSDQQCGRVLYSDFHVSPTAVDPNIGTFPERCLDQPLTPQEQAIEFMLFDLASCIQVDTVAPKAPDVK
jgi:hypothetical protein